MKHMKLIVSVAAAAASLVIGYQVYAHCGKCAADARKIAGQLDQSKMTLAKLVNVAEEHSKGRAISVISDLGENDHAAMHVYCATGDAAAPRIMMCHIDIATGKVLGMKEVHEFPATTKEHAEPHDSHDHAKKHDEDGPAKTIENRTVEAGCGACIYTMPGVEGCPLAVMIDGKPYLVEGATWPNHDYCDRKCQAVVSGKLKSGKFIATSLEPKK